MLDKNTEVEALITQWTSLCGYLEKLDTTHWNVFTIAFTAFTLFSVMSSKSADLGIESFAIFWIFPMALTLVFFYQAYRLREAAVLKGYLFILEERINCLFKKDGTPVNDNLFHWFKEYDIAFMSKNNIVNRLLPVPIILAVIIVYVFLIINQTKNGFCVLYIAYLVLLISLTIVALISILENAKKQTQSRNAKAVKTSAQNAVKAFFKVFGKIPLS